MTRRYRSCSDLTRRNDHHPARNQRRRSGGRNRQNGQIIHSGLLPDWNEGFQCLIRFGQLTLLVSGVGFVQLFAEFSHSCSRSMLLQQGLDSFRPRPGVEFRHRTSSSASRYCSSVDLLTFRAGHTAFDNHIHSKYSRVRYHATAYRAADRYGRSDFRNQMSSQTPARCGPRSRMYFGLGHFNAASSQITPRCFRRLYLPHRHRSSLPAQRYGRRKASSRSGLNVR